MRDSVLVLPSQTAFVTEYDLVAALELRDRAITAVKDRAQYVATNGIDRGFAFPDANWSTGSANNVIRSHFERLSRFERDSLARLRALCPFFTGYALYEVENAAGVVGGDDPLPHVMRYTDATVAANLEARNAAFAARWLELTGPLPLRCIYSPTPRFGEIGQLIAGVIVNHDTVVYQERINLIHDSGLLQWLDEVTARRGELRVLEIGGGYGALASWFKTAFPCCSYTIVDLPECLLFSSLYLGLSRPDLRSGYGLEGVPFGFRFVPNYMAERLGEDFDLVINTLSMSEMSEAQVKRYADLISCRWVAGGGLFFEQNQDNRHAGLLFAQEVLMPFFRHRVALKREGNTEGFPSIWGMNEIALVPPELHGYLRRA